jgi:hypothetical protein
MLQARLAQACIKETTQVQDNNNFLSANSNILVKILFLKIIILKAASFL